MPKIVIDLSQCCGGHQHRGKVVISRTDSYHRLVPPRVGIPGCRGGAPRGEGALANLVSGGTASAPRSLIRVGGAPRRAAPLYIIGAVRQPTFRPGRRSLSPTGPVPPGGSGPIRQSACAGAPPARIPPAVPLLAS